MNFLFNDLSSAKVTKASANLEEEELLSGFISALKLISQTASGKQPVFWSGDLDIFNEDHKFIWDKSVHEIIKKTKRVEIKTALLSFRSRLQLLDCSKAEEYMEHKSSLSTMALAPYLKKAKGGACSISIFSNPDWGVGILSYRKTLDDTKIDLPNIPKLGMTALERFVADAMPFFCHMGRLCGDGENEVLPKLSVSQVFLQNEDLSKLYRVATKDKMGKLAAFFLVGSAVAEINGYEFDKSRSAKNSTGNKLRKIFSHAKKKRFLSIDFEKGAFEFLGGKGKHLGEYNFSGLKLGEADQSGGHDIVV